MKTIVRCLFLLAVLAIAGTAKGHGFNLNLTNSGGTYAITTQSAEDQLDSFGTPGTSGNEPTNLFYETFSGTPTTTFGASFYSVIHGFVAAGSGPWPPPNLPGFPTVGFTATFNIISPLYFSDGTAGAVSASSGTYIRMYDRDIGVAADPGTSPGYIYANGATPFASGFQVSLDDQHEIEKDLYIAPSSTQTYGEYGFAYDVTVTFNTGQTIATGPLVDVFATTATNLGDFADNAYYLQQDAATTAIYNAAMSAGTAVLGTASTWSGAANNTWANTANWEAGAVPGATSGTTSNDTAVFYSGNTTPVVDFGRNVQTILFESANVGPLTLGTTNGNALLLSAGGSIQVTSWVVNPQVVNAPLVLEGANALYTFNSDSTTTSATLSFGGSITGGAAGNTVLTLGGDNTGANTISGAIGNGAATSLALLESGPCNWVLSGQNTYTGGTTVNQGTLTVTSTGTLGSSTSPLTISTAANGIAATVNINGNQSVGTLSGTILGGGTTGVLNIAAGSTLRVNQAGNADFGATLRIAAGTATNFGTFTLQGPNTLEIDAAPTLGANSAINVNGGTLRFNLSSGPATVGWGVTATVASGATLQLAGAVSALSGGGVANIVNNGSTASGGGLLVTGTNQSVGIVMGAATPMNGAITYAGDTVVSNGTSAASLTAAQILQNTLTINAGSTVTILPSGSGSPTATATAASASVATSADPFSGILEAIRSGAATTVAGGQAILAIDSELAGNDPNLDIAASDNFASMLQARYPAIDGEAINPKAVLGWLTYTDDQIVSGSPTNEDSLANLEETLLFGESYIATAQGSFSDLPAGAAPVPEPSAFLLAAFGGLAVALAARTRRTLARTPRAAS